MGDRESDGKFKKGISGNPKGRPRKGNSLSEYIRSNVDIAELVSVLVDKGKEGDGTAIRLLFEYGWGRPDPEFERRIEEIQAKVDQAIKLARQAA